MPSEYRFVAKLMRDQVLREAIASVSLSHEPNCTCRTCRAAQGDERAFEDIVRCLEPRP